MAHGVTCEDLLARVQQLAPVLRAHADQGERERHLMDPIVEALQDAELYHLLVPSTLGGLQVDPLPLYAVVEAVARVDGSTGWCLFINGCAPISAAFLRDDAAKTIYGQGARTIMAGSVYPYGRAVPQTVWGQTRRGEAVAVEERLAFLLAATNATRSAAAAVELAYTAGEGSANYRRSPLQRHMRDMHAVTQHVSTAPRQYVTSGRMLLGLPPNHPTVLL